MVTTTAAERDTLAIRTLLTYFRPRTGRWVTPTGEGWQPALALEAVLTSYERTGDPAYRTVVETSFARYRGRRSHFYDDDGWYLNAWLRAYEVTGSAAYLTEAVALFDQLTEAWDGTCRGGVWWTRDRTYKNAITNELFLLAAARLHRLAPDGAGPGSYLDWALREWSWFRDSGMINSADLINDGLTGDCANNGQTVWTYNQGVILSALVELWRGTGDRDHVAWANRLARAGLAGLVNAQGILVESGEPAHCDGNQLIFKGVFAQGTARLYAADPTTNPRYRTFLTRNADRLWHTGRDRLGRFGLTWWGRSERYNAATHASGSLLIGSVALLADQPGAPITVR